MISLFYTAFKNWVPKYGRLV